MVPFWVFIVVIFWYILLRFIFMQPKARVLINYLAQYVTRKLAY